MTSERSVMAVVPEVPSRLPELLAEARTPLDVLCALTDDGADCAFDLWAMAALRGGNPVVYLCSVPPVAPAAAKAQLDDFVASAGLLECEGDLLMPDWSGAPRQVICLQPDLPPLEMATLECRDMHVTTDEPTGVIIRAAAAGAAAETGKQPAWKRLPVMVQYARPYLRAISLTNSDTAHGMIDVDSGMYSWPYFIDAMEREVARASRQGTELAVAALDLRPLRILGDIPADLHRRIGGHILSCVRKTDLVGRTGKRSYAVFFHGTGPRAALIAAGRIAESLAADAAVAGFISFSLGVSGSDGCGDMEANTLLAQAGEAAAEAAAIAPGRAFVHV